VGGVIPAYHRFVPHRVVSHGAIGATAGPAGADTIIHGGAPRAKGAVGDVALENHVEVGLICASCIADIDVDPAPVGAYDAELWPGNNGASTIHIEIRADRITHPAIWNIDVARSDVGNPTIGLG